MTEVCGFHEVNKGWGADASRDRAVKMQWREVFGETGGRELPECGCGVGGGVWDVDSCVE